MNLEIFLPNLRNKWRVLLKSMQMITEDCTIDCCYKNISFEKKLDSESYIPTPIFLYLHKFHFRVLLYFSSPGLSTFCSVASQSYNSADKGDLKPVLWILAITAPLWSHDCNLGAWQPACTYDWCSIQWSHNQFFLLASYKEGQWGTWQER